MKAIIFAEKIKATFIAMSMNLAMKCRHFGQNIMPITTKTLSKAEILIYEVYVYSGFCLMQL